MSPSGITWWSPLPLGVAATTFRPADGVRGPKRPRAPSLRVDYLTEIVAKFSTGVPDARPCTDFVAMVKAGCE